MRIAKNVIEPARIIPEVTEVTLTLTPDEARHLAHRLNVSSSKTFSTYREEHGLSGEYPRHPFADDIIEGIEAAGVNL